jgi:tetratricopeptide (TPR) repeat protein
MANKIIKIIIASLIFLFPLFFLPFTFEYFEFNKLFLLILLSSTAFIIFLFKILKEKEFKILRTPLDSFLFIFLLIFGISGIIGLSSVDSFFGFYGRFSGAYLGYFGFIILYFLIVNFLPKDKKINAFLIIKILLYSYFISLFVFLLSIFGIVNKFFNSGFSNFFNLTSPSLEIFSLYSFLMFSFLIGYLFFYNQKGAKKNIFVFNIVLFFSFLVLIIIDNYLSWILMLSFGIFLLLFKNFFIATGLKYKKFDFKIIIPVFLILISIFFLTFPSLDLDNKLLKKELPKELRPSITNTFDITKEAFKKNFFLGSGPNTFFYDYSLHRDEKINNNDLWQFRFDRGGSFMLELIATSGLLGFLSFFTLILIIFYLYYVFFVFLKRKEIVNKNKETRFLLIIFINFINLVLILFLYSISILFLFLFFLFIALSMILFRELNLPIFKTSKINLRKNRYQKFFSSLLIFIFLVIFLVIFSYSIKYWIADYYFKKGDEVSLLKAARLNNYRDNYKTALSKLYFNKINNELIKPFEYQDNQYIKNNIIKTIEYAQKAINNNPNSVINWENLGMVYRDLASISNGGEKREVEAFRSAVELEPNNPMLLTELGNSELRAGLYYEAEDSFRRAIEIKKDYYQSKFGLAKTKIKQGKITEALILLNELTLVSDNPEIFYEQGRLYYNRREISKAIESFSKALKINPNHSNSLYGTGLALEVLGENEKALEYFERVSDLNPGNSELKTKLEN